MTYENILSILYEIFAEVLNIDQKQICAETKLSAEVGTNSLRMDSLEFVKVIIAIEDRFHIVVDFEVYFDTIAELAHFVTAAISANK